MARKNARKRALRFSDLMKIQRIGSPVISPDGKRAAFDMARHDSKKNKVTRTIRIVDLATKKITKPTPGPGNHYCPVWSPNGKYLAFVSDRETAKGSQLWVMPCDGGEAKRITSGYGSVGSPVWSSDSKRIAFSRSIVVSKDFKPSKGEIIDDVKGPDRASVYGLANPKSSARTADELLFRHWDSWRDKKRNHIFIVDVQTGKMRDATPFDLDAPPISLGSARDFDFAPDGKEITFVFNPDKIVARSTNNSVFVMPLKGFNPAGKMRCISNTDACDCQPRYSKDGKTIYYLAMAKPGYEADRFRIKAYDRATGETKTYLQRFDRNPYMFELSPDNPETIFFVAPDKGRGTIYRLNLKTGKVFQLTINTNNSMLQVIPGSDHLLVARQSTTQSPDFYLLKSGKGIKPEIQPGPMSPETPVDAGTEAVRLTRFGKIPSNVDMNPAEEFWYKGDEGHQMHGFLIRPPGFNGRRKYPMILLIHGGPQSAFFDDFHYRWNAQMFAAKGAVVAFVNPRGSTGYGQKFTDQISGDWGGRCYRDIMRGVDFIIKNYSFIDGKRIGAAGASFGGFMVNWIAGHSDRFRSLVCHDGVFFSETMAYTTEELWFDEHEHGGLPHVNRKPYIQFSPHRFVGKFKTPTLVVHGGYDFRCPVSEGIGMFTALQVMNVPSRFLYFPDEGHWVLQPANSQVWYEEVIGWLMKYIERK